MSATIDVVIDLSAWPVDGPDLDRLITQWAQPESLGTVARTVTGIIAPGRLREQSIHQRPGWNFLEADSPVAQVSEALQEADRYGSPLLLIRGPVDIGCEALGVLRQSLERDPMFGFALPRIGCVDRCCFLRLLRYGVGVPEWLPRRILPELPDTEVMGETVSPCLLIRTDIIANFGPLDCRFEAVAPAVLHYMASARRCGFRSVLSNRALVGMEGLQCTNQQAPISISARDDLLLHELVPDLERSWGEFRAGLWERFEKLSTVRFDSRSATARPSLLLDVRVGPFYNGTTQAILGTARGFKGLESDWEVALLANPRGAAFEQLEQMFQDSSVYTQVPDRPFTVALRPSQAWYMQDMVDLHSVSLFNVYLMLDTIGWDIVYTAPAHLDGNWRFLADHADGLLFDSEFTRQRFIERFPSGRRTPSLVTHFSTDPDEYVQVHEPPPAGRDGFVLVVGNHLDHKDVRQTVDALAAAFPFQHIKALGLASSTLPLVTALSSGHLSETEVHRLYCEAQLVVFPSFYEGFGFPIVTALAYGRTVLARRSALVEELAARCVRKGRLMVFNRREELVELVGRFVHGEEVPEYPLGLDGTKSQPRTWRDHAEDILQFVDRLVREPARSNWIAREHTVRQMLSYGT
jgi:hypothetical protein